MVGKLNGGGWGNHPNVTTLTLIEGRMIGGFISSLIYLFQEQKHDEGNTEKKFY